MRLQDWWGSIPAAVDKMAGKHNIENALDTRGLGTHLIDSLESFWDRRRVLIMMIGDKIPPPAALIPVAHKLSACIGKL